MTAVATILVSRFPGHVTHGALPMLPELVTIHDDLLTGGFLVFEWFDAGRELEQRAPERYETLAEAWFRVPAGYVATPCGDFARMAFRRPADAHTDALEGTMDRATCSIGDRG